MTTSRNTNLLVALHHWASRQDENFITDAFAHLLRHLIARDKMVGLELLCYLTDERLSVTFDDSPIEIRTQVTVAKGRPDIEISSIDHLVYVEAKVESGLGDRQLERYLEELDACKSPEASTLVVLSRYPVEIHSDISKRVVTRRWYQVAHWLIEALARGDIKDCVNKFLVEQMIDFFKSRNIMMEKVGPEMLTGVRAFRSLTAMLSEAILAQGMTPKISFGHHWAGHYIDKQDFFFGIYYERLNILVFETYQFPVIADVSLDLGIGKIVRDSYTLNKHKWRNELALDSEECNFFEQTRECQMQCIEKFLSDSLEAVKKVQAAT